MIKKLTAENVVIKTAIVDVKTLTISGKQVTLAVFRQLPEESCFEVTIDCFSCDAPTELFNPDGMKLKGEVWGRVNYCPGECKSTSQHHHIVWQSGAELKRAKVFLNFENAFFAEHWLIFFNIILNSSDINSLLAKIQHDPLEPYQVLSGLRWRFDNNLLSQWSDRYYQLTDQIEKTDQLFIAV
jgi:hypothetical protein